MQLERCSTTRLALEPFARRPGPEAQDRATRRAAAAAVLHLRHLARCLVTARQKNPKYHAPRRKRPGSGQKRRPLVSIALVDWKLLRPGRDSSPSPSLEQIRDSPVFGLQASFYPSDGVNSILR